MSELKIRSLRFKDYNSKQDFIIYEEFLIQSTFLFDSKFDSFLVKSIRYKTKATNGWSLYYCCTSFTSLSSPNES